MAATPAITGESTAVLLLELGALMFDVLGRRLRHDFTQEDGIYSFSISPSEYKNVFRHTLAACFYLFCSVLKPNPEIATKFDVALEKEKKYSEHLFREKNVSILQFSNHTTSFT